MVLFTACSNGTSSKEDIKLYASSSLTNLLTDMEKEIEKELSINLILHLAPSSQLVSEIEDGGPFDLFLTPNKEHIEMLTELNAIDQQTIATIAMNDIVCINYHNDLEVNCDFSNLDERVQYIGIADPDTVTLGQFTKELLISQGLWEEWNDRFMLESSASKVFDSTNSGATEVGFVYGSDARFYQYPYVGVDEQLQIPYTIAISSEASQSEIVQDLQNWFLSDRGQQVLKDYGFLIEQ